MPVRLLRPQFGQAVNTLYWAAGTVEDTLRATGNADDQIELASDYAPATRIVASGDANTSRNATTYKLTSSTAQTLTLNTSGYWPVNSILTVISQNPGTATVTPAAGVTINGGTASAMIATPNSEGRLLKVAPDAWVTMDGFVSTVIGSNATVGVGGVTGGLGKLSSAITRVRNRTGRARMAFVGDSTTAGFGSALTTGTGAGNNAGAAGNFLRANSTPQQFAALMQANGIPTRSDSIWGGGNGFLNTVGEYASVDPGNTFGADWSMNFLQTFGGASFAENATGTTSFTTKPWDYAADTFDVYYLTLNTFGQFTVTDTTGTLATIDSTVVVLPPGAGAGGFGRTTVKRNLASKNPISIQRTGGGQIFITAIVPYDSNSPRLEIWNMGWGGSKTADWIVQGSNGWKTYYAITLIDQPDLWHLELGLNDQNQSVADATYAANLQTLAARIKSGGGDLIMGKPHKPYLNSASWLLNANYLAAIDAAASANGAVATVDYSALTLAQTQYFDAPHLTQPGYAAKAALLRDTVLARL